MPTSSLLFRLLATIAGAGRAREQARALTELVDHGRLEALAVWSLHQGRLELLEAKGFPTPLDTLVQHPLSPLWAAIQERSDRPVDPRTLGLESASGAWHLLPLLGRDNRAVGALLAAGEDLGDLEPLRRPFALALERQLHQEAWAVRAQLYDALVELVADGVIAATPDGEVLSFNPALQRLTGWSRDDIERYGWTHLVYANAEQRRNAQQAIAALMLGAPSEGVERELTRKDGSTFKAQIWSRLCTHPSGFAPAMLGVIRSSATARSRQQDEQVDRLAASIAHEFNNLLAAIMGHADLITLHPLPEQVHHHAATIVRSATRGAAITRQILAFSGSTPCHPEPVCPGELVRQVLDLLQPQWPEQIALYVERASSLPLVEIDPGAIQQVLVNLLRNAQSVATNNVIISITQAPLPGSVRYRAPSLKRSTPLVRIRIQDDGPGFSAEALEHLFTPFFSERAQGHGVGLPAVRGIIATHGGAIDVRNEGGAQVDVYLPVSQRPELVLPALHPSDGADRTVWVIDDEPAILEFSQIALATIGFEVHVFDGVRSLRRALTEGAPFPDLVVLDITMDEGGGPAARALLEEAGCDAPVLWTTGHPPSSVVLPDGAYILRKPYTGATLGRTAIQILNAVEEDRPTEAPP